MAITNKSQNWREEAKNSGGFAQVRKALNIFEGTVLDAQFGQWDAGREYIEITTGDNIPIEVTEDLDMDITSKYNFRINCSESPRSFYIADFLEACDKLKLIVPDDLIGKRIRWRKVRREASKPEFSTENFIPETVLGSDLLVQAPSLQPVATPQAEKAEFDPIQAMLSLAVGKTEKQFRTAVSLDPRFQGSPLLAMAKMGAVTETFIKEGKLILEDDVYRKVG